jgi:hypothetical protein
MNMKTPEWNGAQGQEELNRLIGNQKLKGEGKLSLGYVDQQ